MASGALEKRLFALEQLYARRGDCSCRAGEKTMYHNATELARIMAVRCSVHGIRDLGQLVWVGRGLPLRHEDRQFCSCSPCPVRELLFGRRGPLTQAEHEQEKKRWLREYGPGSDEEFRKDQDRVRQLLRIYEFNKSLMR